MSTWEQSVCQEQSVMTDVIAMWATMVLWFNWKQENVGLEGTCSVKCRKSCVNTSVKD